MSNKQKEQIDITHPCIKNMTSMGRGSSSLTSVLNSHGVDMVGRRWFISQYVCVVIFYFLFLLKRNVHIVMFLFFKE